jgi:hypothetical protein
MHKIKHVFILLYASNTEINEKEQAVIIANSNNHFYSEGMTCCTILQKDQPAKYIPAEYRPKTQSKTYRLERFPAPNFPKPTKSRLRTRRKSD